jgi:hypothetical protein
LTAYQQALSPQESDAGRAALIQWQGLRRVAMAPQMWFLAAQFEIE